MGDFGGARMFFCWAGLERKTIHRCPKPPYSRDFHSEWSRGGRFSSSPGMDGLFGTGFITQMTQIELFFKKEISALSAISAIKKQIEMAGEDYANLHNAGEFLCLIRWALKRRNRTF